VDAWRAESVGASFCTFKILNLNDVSFCDFLDDHLSNSISFFYFEVFFREIEKNDTNFSSIIFIDDSCSNINKILPGEAGAGS
jgi:hypothetical protein